MTASAGRHHDRPGHGSESNGPTRCVARLGLLLTAMAAGCSGCHGRCPALPSLTAVRVMLADVERQRQENRAGKADSPGATGGLPTSVSPSATGGLPTSVADRAAHLPAGDSRQPWPIPDSAMPDYGAGRYERGFLHERLASAGEAPAATRKMDGQEPGPLPGFRQTLRRDIRRLPSELWSDIQSVYASPENLLLLGGTYGAALALQSTGPDDTVADRLGEHRIFKDDWRDAFGAAGNPLVHFGLAGLWYVVGQQTQDDHTYEVAGTLRRALMLNGLSVLVGQVASGGHGPNGEFGSFPSGHTSSTFAVASVMHRSYGPWVGMPLYALGGLVAMERLDSDEHFLSDVVMGAVMGLVIGHTIAGERELELAGGRIVPYVDPQTQSSGLAWVVHFK